MKRIIKAKRHTIYIAMLKALIKNAVFEDDKFYKCEGFCILLSNINKDDINYLRRLVFNSDNINIENLPELYEYNPRNRNSVYWFPIFTIDGFYKRKEILEACIEKTKKQMS